MTRSKRILIVHNGHTNSTSGQLFSSLAGFLAQRYDCTLAANVDAALSLRGFLRTVADNLARVAKILRADVLILHSYSLFSLPNILLARCVGTRIVLFQWDIYPSTLAGEVLTRSPLRTVFDRVERTVARLVHVMVIPSEDFRPFVRHPDVRVMPLWPPHPEHAVLPSTASIAVDREVRICFAGQITPLRGLELAIAHLETAATMPVELHIFSGDALPRGVTAHHNLRIVHHGQVSSRRLLDQLSEMHFGLISLHPDMDQPGFPSKVFEYVLAGLPILYFGRSLPDFNLLLERTEVGFDITEQMDINLFQLYREMKANFVLSRQSFLEKTGLDWKKIDPLLY